MRSHRVPGAWGSDSRLLPTHLPESRTASSALAALALYSQTTTSYLGIWAPQELIIAGTRPRYSTVKGSEQSGADCVCVTPRVGHNERRTSEPLRQIVHAPIRA